MHQSVGLCRRVAANRSSHNSGITAQRELALQQLVFTALVHHNQNDVSFASTDLSTKASALDLNRSGRTPARTIAASQKTLAVFGSDDEAAFLHVRNNNNALRLAQQLTWYALVLRMHNFAENLG